jgi:threonine dehydratase
MSQPAQTIELRDLYAAAARVRDVVVRTPLVRSMALSNQCGADVYLKLENQQVTGSFKVRGAANCLRQLAPEQRRRGVITVSTGNHGRAVAYMGKLIGVRAVVCVPDLVLPHKVEAMRALGAEVRIAGANQDEAEALAVEIAQREGLTLVSPFDDPAIIAGQGTIALEILEDLPCVDTVVVPLSGGGLMGGIALGMKAASSQIRTIGAAMARGPVMYHSLRAGYPIQMEEEKTLADSLMGGIGLNNRYTFALAAALVDDVVLLSEAEIAAAMVFSLRAERQVVEGGGAVALGALLHNKVSAPGQTVVAVVSGGNVHMDTLLGLAGAEGHRLAA